MKEHVLSSLRMFRFISPLVLAIGISLLSGCSTGLTPTPTSPDFGFTDLITPTALTAVDRRMVVARIEIPISLTPKSSAAVSADTNIGTISSVSTSGIQVQFAGPIQQQFGTPVAMVSGNITVDFSAAGISSSAPFFIGARLKSGPKLTNPNSSTLVGLHISTGNSGVSPNSVDYVAVETSFVGVTTGLASPTGTVSQPFSIRFDLSDSQLTTYSGTLILEYSVQIGASIRLNSQTQANLLGRGINIGNGLEENPEGANEGLVVTAADFAIIRNAGFDTVRLPINWADRSGSAPDYTIDPAFFTRVDTVIQEALDAGLNVVINCHNFHAFSLAPQSEKDRLFAIWRQVANRYKHHSSRLYFELFNEPTDQITAAEWNAIQLELLGIVRGIDPFHTALISGVNWSNVESLATLSVPATENIIAVVHYYDPILFTHQFAAWLGNDFSVKNVVWPGPPSSRVDPPANASNWVFTWFANYNSLPAETNPASENQVNTHFATMTAWQNQHIPIYISEFGTYKFADLTSRVNWTHTVRTQADAANISWCVWQYVAGFGIYNRTTRQWNADLLNVLIP